MMDPPDYEMIYTEEIEFNRTSELRKTFCSLGFDSRAIYNISFVNHKVLEITLAPDIKSRLVETLKAEGISILKRYDPIVPADPDATDSLRQHFLDGWKRRVDKIIDQTRNPKAKAIFEAWKKKVLNP